MKISLNQMPNISRDTPSLPIACLAKELKKKEYEVARCEFNLLCGKDIWNQYFLKINQSDLILENIINRKFSFSNPKYSKLKKYINFCKKKVLSSDPDIVCLFVNHLNQNLSLLLANEIKIQKPKIKIIFEGGKHYFNDQESYKILNTRIMDFIIVGEGESIIPNLISQIEKNEKITTSGVIHIVNNYIVTMNKWFPEKNQLSFSFPDFREEDIQMSNYPSVLPLTTSRGCFFECAFCSVPDSWKKFRQRKIDDIIDEIRYHKNKFSTKIFKFEDHLFNSDKEFVVDFCNRMIAENLNVKWGSNFRVADYFNSDLCSLLKEAGCDYVVFGAESGSNEVLSAMNKNMDTSLIEKCIISASNNDIWVHLNYIVGFPTENERDFIGTIDFIIKNANYINSLQIFPFSYRKNAIELKNRILNIDKQIPRDRLKIINSILVYNDSPIFNCSTKPIIKVNESKYQEFIENLTGMHDLELLIGKICNNKCIFCSNKGVDMPSIYSFKDISNKLESQDPRFRKNLHIVGGEPTMHPDFINILEYAKNIGYQSIYIRSNGRLLSSKNYLDKLISLKVNIGLSIHGHNAKLHDQITGIDGSFNQVLKSVELLNSKGYPFTTNTVICKVNQDHMVEIAEFMSKKNSTDILFSLMSAVGLKKNDIIDLIPDFSILKEKINIIDKDNINYLDFPLCLLKAVKQNNDLRSNEKKVIIGLKEFNCIENKQCNEKKKYGFCLRCNLRKDCDGIWKMYHVKNKYW
ncbi:radical SAM protein [Candidatus Woesearchaeota archaeon]|nr:radical SAM protein [Candidatus Woesearchaeota archaeon]